MLQLKSWMLKQNKINNGGLTFLLFYRLKDHSKAKGERIGYEQL